MNRPLSHAFAALVGHLEAGAPDGTTRFAKLSQEAQDIVVSSAIGEYDETGPPAMSDAVRAELLEWSKPEPGEEEA
jgi:hypothetical protein